MADVLSTSELTERLDGLKRRFEKAESGAEFAELCREEAELLSPRRTATVLSLPAAHVPGAGSEPEEVEAAPRPCNWEKMSGICMVCGTGPDEECEIEREERRASK